MAPRWLSALRSLMKRRRAGHRVSHYDVSESDDDSPSGAHTPTEKHAHTDWGHRTNCASARTSYLELPASPHKKQQRSSSVPPSLPSLYTDTSSVYELPSAPLDVDYLYYQLEQIEDDPAPRKRTAGDRPIRQWSTEVDSFLAELLRLEGRGDYIDRDCSCGAKEALYRCEDCHDVSLHCRQCTLAAHLCHPLHRLRRWDDDHFTRVTLKSLGLVVQLGHSPGQACMNPRIPWGDDFVLIDLNGIHELTVRYCGCESAVPHHLQLLRARWYPATSVSPKTAATFRVLETFQLLSVQSKLSAFEFYSTLARRTDNTNVNAPKDRYPSFLAMAREWRHLKMMKRAGRGNDPDGTAGTAPGACAVECPACPQPGKNTPVDAPESKRWLQRLFLAIDANFRLKRKKVSSDDDDPSLNNGAAYIVEEQAYKNHINTYGTLEPDISDHCNNHDAVKLATLKGAVGLAASGVASVDCARHEVKRPCSTGDLQKGERYVNVDYLLHSSLQQNAPIDILASYDIACHFDRNLPSRFSKYGFILDHNLEWAIPKFHINAHREACRAIYNLRYIPFCARDDGEGIERIWARLNAAAASTREMGPGSRRDTLDDIFSHHNWLKVCFLPATLLKRIKKAVVERNEQVTAFDQFTSTLPSEAMSRWRQAVEAWEADRSQPNPFLLKRLAITQAAIKRQLAEEDAAALKAGTAELMHDKCSASGMIISGIELEDTQRRIKKEASALPAHATDIQRARALEHQNALHRRVDAWIDIQQLYMPGVAIQRQRLLAANDTAALPYNIPLLLPSANVTTVPASPNLMELEWRLRRAQAFDALADLRAHLEVRSHLYKFKDRFARGQRANTRAQTIIKQAEVKIDEDAARYRAAYAALRSLANTLGKAGWEADFAPLHAADIRHVTEGMEGESEGRRTLSWIWKAARSAHSVDTETCTQGAMEESLQETLRIEWCKARARAARWTEEVELLLEEMRRTIAYHAWRAAEWHAVVGKVHTDCPDYLEGANAYARRQATIRVAMRDFCAASWRHVPQWVRLGLEATTDDLDAMDGQPP
ncbi:hypothetical protein L226DRAFT_546322 [Lentinus tigrinus ALCF2SS1-7]|uniref:CxC2-like cysteine cluster KDZ transposase-associated domain-containing protein n=1 Tax=Lentinus tigrinus ALCF2SS1-6 TaxID=1328759 RepID=A0A5C2RYB4_9APHY|nr:hypothetical protein L227DRAFT_588150 [Lentinus tigrinus ALCF2SS1-6]RPD74061.1 hypothetical protein L226DRAFT_546322 [Lentinus tigrinus ALCF2SS1-7]